jgi:hypothetical protein
MYFLIAIIVIFAGLGFFFIKKDEMVTPIVIDDTNKISLCFYRETKTNQGLYDVALLRLNINGEKVNGEFKNLPAEKDSKVGNFEGIVGPVDKSMMARTADVWWNSMAEGLQVKEQLKIVFGEGTAQALFGEMVDRGDGVYIYKDTNKLTYGVAMTDVECGRLYFVGRNCYEYNHNATTTEPYTVKEKIDITRFGNSVTGTKSGTQKGPEMTNGYNGTLAGDVGEDTMNTLFSYVIDGSSQKEKEIYNIGEDSLIKYRYVLKEEKGILVPDTTTTPKEMVYSKVSCSSI